jgi:hypothetical protein
MTERERRAGPGGTEDNVRDELDEAAERGRPGRDASKEASKKKRAQAASRTTSRTSGTSRRNANGLGAGGGSYASVRRYGRGSDPRPTRPRRRLGHRGRCRRSYRVGRWKR